jgi:polyisoprenyl-teichoic acid--peptidoglycan teichoic acid transferase
MRKNPHSTDGFMIPRRARAASDSRRLGVDNLQVPQQFVQDGIKNTLPSPRLDNSKMSKKDLDESLKAIDIDSPQPKKRRFRKPSKKTVKRVIIVLILLLLLVGGYLAVKAFMASSQIFKGNVFDLLGQGQPLKMDENGRSNILVFGTSEDDRAHVDAGPNLTDSIMMISLDQKHNKALITSVPRDLWVKYDQACISGYEGKINVVYQCASEDGKNKEAGAKALMKTVGDVYGLDMHYYVQVNYTALKEAVDAVGGVNIKIESDDPRGIYDPNFDWECNYKCTLVKYPNGPAHLDGKHALMLARARNSAGGYGLAGGNFDRERNQQKILIALRDKAASAGTLANPAAVGKLIDSLGKNIRTSFNTKEVRTLVTVGQKTKGSNITTIRLDDPEDPLVTTGMVSGQSVVRPVLGIYDFSAIHAFIQKKVSTDPVIQEEAVIDVLNGSDTAGVAQTAADELKAKGYTIGTIGNAPAGDYGKAKIYQIAKDKPGTLKKLEQRYGVKASTKLPAGVTSQAAFVVIIGRASE